MGVDYANGAWSNPNYSDLIIGYHTGIRIGGAYSGVRFYNNSPTTDANNDGNGDGNEVLLMTVGGGGTATSGEHVYIENSLYIKNGGSTNNVAWNAGNDGSGSGLDADLLDGQHASAFLGVNATAVEASSLDIVDTRYDGARAPNDYADHKVTAEFTDDINGAWYSALTVKGWHDGYAPWQLVAYSSTGQSEEFYVRFGHGSNNTWTGLRTIWHSGNDGSGSGLDADLLDGLNSTQFIRSDTQATTSAPLTIGVNWGQGTYNSAFVIQGTYPSWETRGTSAQNFGWLHHQDGSGNYTLFSIASYDQSNWTQRYIFYKTGDFTATGNITAYSDVSKKKDIRPLEGASDYLAALDAKRYRWKEDDREDIGFIAQDVEAAGLDVFVVDNETQDPKTGEQIESVKSLDYARMVSVLWQAVKELKAEVDDLKSKLEEVK
jgi:hypothetical protein